MNIIGLTIEYSTYFNVLLETFIIFFSIIPNYSIILINNNRQIFSYLCVEFYFENIPKDFNKIQQIYCFSVHKKMFTNLRH